MSAEVIELAAAKRRQARCLPPAELSPEEFLRAYEAASPEKRAEIQREMLEILAQRNECEGRLAADEPSPFYALVDRLMAARPDLGWSAAVTCANDIERGDTTFEAVAAGEPLTAELLQPVVRAYDVLRDAEEVVQKALQFAARHSGRSVISVKRVLQHLRKGHRLGPPPPDGAA